MSRFKQLFIASAGCVILAAMPAGLNALDAGCDWAKADGTETAKNVPAAMAKAKRCNAVSFIFQMCNGKTQVLPQPSSGRNLSGFSAYSEIQ